MDCARGIGLSLILAMTSIAEAGSLDERNEFYKKAFASQNIRLQCKTDRELGRASAQTSFLRYAYDCGSYFVNAPILGAGVESSRTYLVEVQRSPKDICYRAGWLMGIVDSTLNMNTTCDPELSEARRIALQKRIDACKLVSDQVKADAETLGQMVLANPDTEEEKEFRRSLVLYVRIGATEEAWKAVIEKEKNQDYGSLPCSVLLYQ